MSNPDLTDLTRRFADDLTVELDARADPKTRAWWERYLKGDARFRGVRMADVRSIVDALVERHAPDASVEARVSIALSLMSYEHTEDKLAGVLLLAEHTLDELDGAHLETLAEPLADGRLADWNIVDWYSVKVLGPLVSADADELRRRVEALSNWRTAEGMWQRRAAAVALTGLAARDTEAFPGFHRIALEIASANAEDPRRWSQTSVGWLLRELSRHHAQLVREFLADHPHLSTEATANATKYLPNDPQ